MNINNITSVLEFISKELQFINKIYVDKIYYNA